MEITSFSTILLNEMRKSKASFGKTAQKLSTELSLKFSVTQKNQACIKFSICPSKQTWFKIDTKLSTKFAFNSQLISTPYRSSSWKATPKKIIDL